MLMPAIHPNVKLRLRTSTRKSFLATLSCRVRVGRADHAELGGSGVA
jgi:hypothetical protein